MKTPYAIAMIALLGLLAITPAQAGIITNAASIQNGDLLLGFDVATTGIGTQRNLLIDLGQYSDLGSLGSVNLAADLTTVFGSANPAGVKYGVIGVTDAPANTTYLTTPTASYLYAKHNASQVGSMQGNYLQPLDPGQVNVGTLGYDLANAYQTTAHGAYILSTDPNSWTTQNPTTAPFGFYSGSTMEVALGSANYLDLIPVSTSVQNATQVGYFNVSTAGVLTYTAVPEPGTYGLMGLGAAFLMVMIARRKKARMASCNSGQ